MSGRWSQPVAVDEVALVFGGGNLSELMPAYDEIPEEFKRDYNPWCKWQSRWFFRGLDKIPAAKDGVDLDLALRHLKAIQGSFEPSHEHKEAAVAYLASLWLVAP